MFVVCSIYYSAYSRDIPNGVIKIGVVLLDDRAGLPRCRLARPRVQGFLKTKNEVDRMPTNSKHPETLVLHSGYRSDPATTAVAVPIYQTTSF